MSNMNNEKTGCNFKGSMAISLIGWVMLTAFPSASFTDESVKSIIVVLLCLIYAYLLFVEKNTSGSKYPKGSFMTLEGVANLFKNPRVVLAGWVHYLAFDLMVGLYIKNDAIEHGINYWLVIPCLLLTCLFGPLGYLVYFALRLFLI